MKDFRLDDWKHLSAEDRERLRKDFPMLVAMIEREEEHKNAMKGLVASGQV